MYTTEQLINLFAADMTKNYITQLSAALRQQHFDLDKLIDLYFTRIHVLLLGRPG
jgi:hypothetical protein